MQTCPNCGFTQNRDTARFCSNCAAPLAPSAPVTCPRCGTQNLPGARFCSNCASALTNAPAAGMTGLLTPNTLLQSRYLITRKLGQGGMGAVYQAQDARLPGKLWAIKEMSDAQLTDPAERANAIAAFRREAQLLATLDHANLPKVVDFFDEGGRHYLVMDFIEGQTLEQMVAATPGFLPEPTVLAWIEQVCDVLEYLHTRQPPIVFRDLKPANIMLTPEGKIKLIDFGIARFFKPGKTRDTAAYGTVGYAAPEQFGTGQTDARSDIYSLGVTLHTLLTKYDPALTPFNLPTARNINPAISVQTEAVIARATSPASIERFQSASEMRQALRQHTVPVTPSPQQIVPHPLPTVSVSQVPPREVVMPAKVSLKQTPWSLGLLWMFMTIGGQVAGGTITWLLAVSLIGAWGKVVSSDVFAWWNPAMGKNVFGIGPLRIPELVIMIVFMVAVVGIGGIAQWLILRQYTKKANWWVGTTMLGISVGTIMSDQLTHTILVLIIPLVHAIEPRLSYQFLFPASRAIFGFVTGMVVGVTQCLSLRYVRSSGWWIPTNAIAFTVASLASEEGLIPLKLLAFSVRWIVYGFVFEEGVLPSYVSWAIGLILSGVITGTVLVWLLRGSNFLDSDQRSSAHARK